jgi:hypothetical protein
MNSITQGAPANEAAEASGGEARTFSSDAGDVDPPVNYDESALLEREIDGIDYRIDVGRAGTALCISTRSSGNWTWEFRGEARWQVGVLRCKAFDRSILSQLSTALAEAAADSQS